MTRNFIYALLAATFLSACNNAPDCEPKERDKALLSIDSLATKSNWPKDLDIIGFAGPDLTPSPACITTAPSGEVYVGVDMMGSLGKAPGRGRIIKLVDCNNDGIIDSHTEYAKVDNPRGIISLGDKLYVLHTVFTDSLASGMDLVLFEDKDHDGLADGPPKPIVEHISNVNFIRSRGTDHATNGIRMGIDGWIYIAVGDFGFHEAVDRTGKKLTMLGGGIVRVRPDGTEMEIYTHGTRNIYDVAIDPYMNIFTRDNTNDGKGWNIRFSHHIQSGEYGYPLLFKHFTEEILPGLVDLGGGSGTGSLFMDDPNWPAKYNNVPMMADWGRNELYLHRVTPSGPSFTQQEEDFIQLAQITDLDVDGSGRLYMAAWNGAGYTGDSSKGFVVRAVPKGWTYKPFPNIQKLSIDELGALLKADGAVARQTAQQELMARGGDKATAAAWKVADDKTLPLYARVAGIFTYAQIAGKNGIKNLTELTNDAAVKEFALRALADRKPFVADVPSEPFMKALSDTSQRVKAAAIIGLGRLGKAEAAEALLQTPVPASFTAPAKGVEGPHATPNADIILPHLAVRALVQLNAVDACIKAVGTDNSTIALWALRYMHDPGAVEGLIAAYNKTEDASLKSQILVTLARLYKEETPYDGSYWWSTRPDDHGPYYKAETWASSDPIKNLMMNEWKKADKKQKEFYADLNGKFRMGIDEFGGNEELEKAEETKIDLNKIRNKKGQIGQTSIEDVMLAMDKIQGNAADGKRIFIQQGCPACHSLSKSEVMKGPFMGQIGSIMSRKQIAESILKPNASISQGFSSVAITTKDGKSVMGFVTGESSDKLTLRDITGAVHNINTKDIKSREELKTSIMPPGLANSLSYEEFASLITFLYQQKG
ncbi:MAG: heme-binding protein [Sphingobacteriales bacterium 40-81]|nr:MAG: heme-binding protein [Sphingobacteriales bacterium 40-81]